MAIIDSTAPRSQSYIRGLAGVSTAFGTTSGDWNGIRGVYRISDIERIRDVGRIRGVAGSGASGVIVVAFVGAEALGGSGAFG